jgi:hypothetical protein
VNRNTLLGSILLAACGTNHTTLPVATPTGTVATTDTAPDDPSRGPLKLELQVLSARGDVRARGDDGHWRPLATGASLAGVRELQVTRQGAIVALGHGDAAGRMWLRAGSTVKLSQDDNGVHVSLETGRARYRRDASALPGFVDGKAIEGDFVLDARGDRHELTSVGARPELADWALALERDEDGAGVGRMEAPAANAGAPAEPLALRRVIVDVHTSGDFAVTEVEHVFYNPADRNREGTFRFPVPDGAMLTGMAMEVNGKLVEGEIVEREKAREVYDKIVDQMQDPALLEWEAGNWFKLRVFPVEAKQEKRVVIRYATPLVHGPNGWEYDYALGKQDPGQDIGDLVVKVDGKVVEHDQKVTAGIDLAVPVGDDHVPPVMQERRPDGVYTAVRIPMPGAATTTAPSSAGPRKIAVIVDTSRSALEGKALALQLVKTALGELGAKDQFVILASDVAVTAETPDFVAAAPASIDAALAFLGNIEPDGASNLAAALTAAAALHPTDVIYVGDGIPTCGERDAAKLSALADTVKAPIHAALIGKGASTELWRELAGRSGGRAVIVHAELDAARFALAATHAGDVPRLTDAKIIAPDGAIAFPAHATTIYAGDELVALMKTQDVPKTLELTGERDGKPVEQTISLASAQPVEHVAQRWAAYELTAMETADATREDIVKLSQDYGVLSRFTSLLVLENDEAYKQYQIARKQEEIQKLAQAAAPTVTGGDLDTLGARQASLSPDEIQPGDPEIKIPAPQDARQVVVSFPFGETKLAVWDTDANAWMVRFLIDKDTPDGEYQVRVTITHADGRIEVTSLPYTVDTKPPAIQLTVKKIPGGYRIHARQIGRGRKDADRVELQLPDGSIFVVPQTSRGNFEGDWMTSPLTQPVQLRVVVRDRALNQAVKAFTLGGAQ